MSAERTRLSNPQDPKCPKCGRAYLEVFYEPGAQLPSYRCICYIAPPGCGHVWRAKPKPDRPPRHQQVFPTSQQSLFAGGTEWPPP